MPRWCSLSLVAALVLALGGCTAQSGKDSSGDFSGEQKAVANAIEDLQQAAGKGDEGKICGDLLTPALARSLGTGGRSCEVAVQDAIDDTDTFELQVDSVRISGATASANVSSDRGDAPDQTATLKLAKSSDGWRVSDLGR